MNELTECHCADCNPAAWWMIVCRKCGNKRCPHATHHLNECTGSNASGQAMEHQARPMVNATGQAPMVKNGPTAAEAKAQYDAARDRFYETGEGEDFSEAMRKVEAWQAAVNRESENQRPPDRPTGIEARVCEDIAARQRVGLAKYGVSVEDSQDDMLRHAYEEALDLSVYLRAELERRDG